MKAKSSAHQSRLPPRKTLELGETLPFLRHGESSVAAAGAQTREAGQFAQFYANLRRIRFEYGQKPTLAANRALKPSC
jgi:hypothetical protein